MTMLIFDHGYELTKLNKLTKTLSMILAFDLVAPLPSSEIHSLASPVVWLPEDVFLYSLFSSSSYDESYNTSGTSK